MDPFQGVRKINQNTHLYFSDQIIKPHFGQKDPLMAARQTRPSEAELAQGGQLWVALDASCGPYSQSFYHPLYGEMKTPLAMTMTMTI